MRPEVERVRFEITRTDGRGEFPIEVNVNHLEVRLRICHLSERPKTGDVSTARKEKQREMDQNTESHACSWVLRVPY